MKHAKRTKVRTLWLIAVIAIIGFVLTGCKEPDGNNTTTPAYTHQWGEWTVTADATCVTAGSRTRACSSCDETQTEAIAIDTVNGHYMQVVEGEVELAPTCEETGFGKMACAREGCDHVENGAVIPVLGHDLHVKVGGLVIEDSTCMEGGFGEFECIRDGCDHTENDTLPIDPEAHNLSDWRVVTASSCQTQGEEEQHCRADGCGYSEEKPININPDAHKWRYLPGATEATCIEPGSGERECEYDLCPARGESGEEYPIDPNNHKNVSEDFYIPADKGATCTATGEEFNQCEDCDKYIEETMQIVPSLGGHTYPATIPATCTDPSEPQPCNRLIGETVCGHHNPEVIEPALGHISNGTWTVVSNVIGGDCTRQGCVGRQTLLEYILASPHAGTAADPVPLKISIDLGTMGTATNWRRAETGLLAVLDAGGKLVALDLSGSTRSGAGAFTTGSLTDTDTPGLAGLRQIVSLVMPNTTVTSIPAEAFRNCANLTSITIPDSVTSIGANAFLGCTGLTSITIPSNSVQTIGNNAFQGCTGLISITLPMVGATANTTRYFGQLFGATSDSAQIDAANTHAALKTVVITRSGFNTITTNAFRDWSGITSITIPDSVTSIGANAFQGCTGLTSIHIPASVTSIGPNAFSDCTNVASVTVAPGNANFSTNNNVLFSATAVVFVPSAANLNGGVIIPNGITAIGSTLFWHRPGLTSLVIPDTVTTIGINAFQGCTGLTSITLPMVGATANTTGFFGRLFGAATPENQADIAAAHAALKTVVITRSGNNTISFNAFRGWSGITSITIPDSITSIDSSAFSGCTGLTSITIPNSVTSIGSSAFSGCTGLTSITIPDSVTSIIGGAFSGCTGLTSITLPLVGATVGSTTTLESLFGTVSATLKTVVITRSGDNTIPSSAFNNWSGITSITIPNSVTSIGILAFNGCTGLTSITIPDSVTTISTNAFRGCTGLTSITIPNSVTSIGGTAFANCTNLTLFTLERWMPGLSDNERITTNGGSSVYGSNSLRIVVPVGSVAVYKAADGWNSTSTNGPRNRIHAVGCSNTSVTVNCTECE